MNIHWVLAAVGFLNIGYVICDTSITLDSDTECGGTYNLKDGTLQIIYHGTRLNDCTFTVDTNDSTKKICAYFEKMSINSCETTIKFYGYHGKYGERMDFHTFSCESDETTEYCPALVTKLHITLKHWGPQTADEVNMKITYKIDNTYIYLIVGFVCLAVLMIIIPAVIIIRYRKHKAGVKLVSNSKQDLITTLS
ncbi:uncharacterized protein LOC123528957 isoform X2 [Mercenaria mercenaria]|uniref:uncharacterized protein LOC123528957 isoform X2 n=1 Tax=Mercenaria mercenaria TaxID=6596 RepID=UPI00234F006B|nr:uncharacterized protein LOC123528957 isoform X2 [Mercenaria mercenaria]